MILLPYCIPQKRRDFSPKLDNPMVGWPLAISKRGEFHDLIFDRGTLCYVEIF